ncbi:SpaA isopeptide-forming pilin-related protein [Anaerococcus prevotii]|uniref:LPXTG-motif cell wall anchor domain protein n=1 Tax=Anaerococcus prevotii ACS-065-V-Col13 TaxID=879305 RepID=F0GV37_9FIRM|nr:SpaA isopeptide-forming pilin-related protein [Anaerococcus prevotii]EGC82245.1 LPXTG-motif cell wall anchor domain protein [Anaerococcus prevotii ACS-065-V-Col13]
MKRRLKDFTVKLFSLILAITMCIPTNVYALADDGDEEMPTIMRLDEDSETEQTEETSDSEDIPTISEEDRNNYDISYDAKLSDSFDSIIYTIKISKKEESIHDPEKKMTLALATNKNQSLTDLQVDHVRDLEEGEVNYSVDSKEESNLHTFAITTPTSKTGLEYTIKAPIAKDAIDAEKLYSLDMSVDIGDVNIDLRRISYKFMEEASEDNPEEVRLVLTNIKEADDAFQKIAYNKSDEEGKADSLVYTDYLISKDKQDEASISEKRNEVNYKLILDENQDPTTGKIALDYYKANDKGFVLQKEFSTEIAYQEDLTLDVPAGYLLKLTYTNQTDKTKTKVENYSVNNRQVKNPRFVKEEEKKEDEEEDPAPAEKEEKPVEDDSNKEEEKNPAESKKENQVSKENQKANNQKADKEISKDPQKDLADKKETQKENKEEAPKEVKEEKPQETTKKEKSDDKTIEENSGQKEGKETESNKDNSKEEASNQKAAEDFSKELAKVKEETANDKNEKGLTDSIKGLFGLSDLDKADRKLKAALKDEANGLAEIQKLLTSLRSEYNLSRSDQAKLMADNEDAIKNLIRKDADTNFDPSLLFASTNETTASNLEESRDDVVQIIDPGDSNYEVNADAYANPVIKDGKLQGYNWTIKVSSGTDLKALGLKVNFTEVVGSGLGEFKNSNVELGDNPIKGNFGIHDSKHHEVNQEGVKEITYNFYTPVQGMQEKYIMDISIILTEKKDNEGNPRVGAKRFVMDGWPADKVKEATPIRAGMNNRTTILGEFTQESTARWTVTDAISTGDDKGTDGNSADTKLPWETRKLSDNQTMSSSKMAVYGIDNNKNSDTYGQMVAITNETDLNKTIPGKGTNPNTNQAVGTIAVYGYDTSFEKTENNPLTLGGVAISRYEDINIDQHWNLDQGLKMPAQTLKAVDPSDESNILGSTGENDVPEQSVQPGGQESRSITIHDVKVWNIKGEREFTKTQPKIVQTFPTDKKDSNGKTISYYENHNYYDPNTKGYNIRNIGTVEEVPNRASFTIVKIDEKDPNKKLAGAKFKLSNGPEVVTDANGEATFTNIPPGTYTFQETKAPKGYKLDGEEKKITISDDGNVNVSGKNVDFSQAAGKTEVVEHNNYPNYPDYMNAMHYGKVDDSGNVEFYLYLKPIAPRQGGQTDRNTRLDISIPGGSITDVKAYDVSPGYRANVKSAMEAQTAGTLNLVNNVIGANHNKVITGTPDKLDNYTRRTGYQIYFPKERFAGDWGFLVKVKADIGANDSANLYYDWLTDEDTANQANLQKIVRLSKNTSGADDKPTLTIKNTPFEKKPIEVIKFADTFTDGKRDRLSGAEFTLKDSEGNVIANAITDENGKASFGEYPEGRYIVEETKAPDGYEKNGVYFEVEVNESQEVSYTARFENSSAPPQPGQDYFIEKGEEIGGTSENIVTSVNQWLDYNEGQAYSRGERPKVWEAYRYESLKYHADITLSQSKKGDRFEIQFDPNLDFTQYFNGFPKLRINGKDVADPYFNYETNLLTYVFNENTGGKAVTATIDLIGMIPSKYYAKNTGTYPFTITVQPNQTGISGQKYDKNIEAFFDAHDSGYNEPVQNYYFREIYEENGEYYVDVISYYNVIGDRNPYKKVKPKTLNYNWITTKFQGGNIADWVGEGTEPRQVLDRVKIYRTEANVRVINNDFLVNDYMPLSMGFNAEQEPNIYRPVFDASVDPTQNATISQNGITLIYDKNQINPNGKLIDNKNQPLKIKMPSINNGEGYVIEQRFKIPDIDAFNNKWRAFVMNNGNLKSAFASGANKSFATGDQTGGETPKYYKEEVGVINKKYTPGQFKIIKSNQVDNSKLPGATFELTDANNTIYRTSGNNGELSFTNLAPGSYTLKETRAPKGYVKSEKIWSVTVYADGSVRITQIGILGSDESYFGDNENIIIMPVSNKPSGADFRVYKKDSDGKALEGARFKITKENDSTFQAIEKSSNENGVVEFEGLTKGTYIIEESQAPAGYKELNKKWVLVVDKNENKKVYNYRENIDQTLNSILEREGVNWVDVAGRSIDGWEPYDNRYTGWTGNNVNPFKMGTRIVGINRDEKYIIQRYVINPEAASIGATTATIHREKPDYPNMEWYKGDEVYQVFKLNKPVTGLISEIRLAEYNAEDITSQVGKDVDKSRTDQPKRLKLDFPETNKPLVVDIKVPYKDEAGGVGTGMDWTENGTTYWKSDYYERASVIKEASPVVSTDGNIIGSYVGEGSLDVTNEFKTFDFKLKKVKEDDNTKAIEGAKFKLTGPGEGGEEREITTDTDGIISFDKLRPGIYKLEEIEPAPGYEKSNVDWTVRITSDGHKYIKANNQAGLTANTNLVDPNSNGTNNITPVRTLAYRGLLENNSELLANKNLAESPSLKSMDEFNTRERLDLAENTLEFSEESISNPLGAASDWEDVDPNASTGRRVGIQSKELASTKITEINKGEKKFRQVFLIKDEYILTKREVQFHREPEQYGLNFDDVKTTYKIYRVDPKSTLDNPIGKKDVTNSCNQSLTTPTGKQERIKSEIPWTIGGPLYVEIEASYNDQYGVGLGVDYFYSKDSILRDDLSVWVADSYDNEASINKNLVSSYNLNITDVANGKVTANKNTGINQGENVTLTVSPIEGYELEKLTVAGVDVTNSVKNGKYSFKMPASNVAVSATFKEKLYSVWTQTVEHGSISASPNRDVAAGKQVTMTSNPESGYKLEKITYNDNKGQEHTLKLDENNQFTMPAYSVALTAHFVDALPSYKVEVTQPQKGGTISTNPTSAKEGDTVSLSATPSEGYLLDKFVVTYGDKTVDVENNQFTMPNSNVTVTATFKDKPKNVYPISVEPSQNGSVGVVSSATNGDTVAVSVNPNEYYELDTLTVTDKNGTPVQVNGLEFTMPESAVNISATFKVKEITGPQEGEIAIPSDGELIKITNKQTGLDLKIFKRDDNSRPLEGGKFTLKKTNYDYTTEDTTFRKINGISDSDGRLVFTDNDGNEQTLALQPGYYLLEETEAPSGYKKAQAPWKIHVYEDKKTNQLKAEYQGPDETPKSFINSDKALDNSGNTTGIKTTTNGIKYAARMTNINTEGKTYIQRIYIDTRAYNRPVNVQIKPVIKREELDAPGKPPKIGYGGKYGVKTVYRSTYEIKGLDTNPTDAKLNDIFRNYTIANDDVSVVNTARWRPFDWGFDEDQLNLDPGVYYIDVEGFYDDNITKEDIGKIEMQVDFKTPRYFWQADGFNQNGSQHFKLGGSYQAGAETFGSVYQKDTYVNGVLKKKGTPTPWGESKPYGQKYPNWLSKEFTDQYNRNYKFGIVAVRYNGTDQTIDSVKTSINIRPLYTSTKTTQVGSEGMDIVNDEERYNITFSKHGRNDINEDVNSEEVTKRRLEGAVFKLQEFVINDYKDVEGSTISSAFNGYFGFRGLKPGRYRLIEVKAPEGYKPIDGPLLYFTVETIKTNSGKIVDPESGEVVDIKSINVKFAENDKKAYKLSDLSMVNPDDSNTIIKVNSVDSKKISIKDSKIVNPITNAIVDLKDLYIVSGNKSYPISRSKIIDDSSGYISLEYGDANGVYQYVPEKSTSEKDGKLVDFVTSATAKNMGKIINEKPGKGEITVKKFDQQGNELKATDQLPGAKFRLTNKSTGAKEEKTVGSDGKLKFTGLNIGDYRLEEVKSPDGYINNKQVWNFTVGGEGLDPYAGDAPQRRKDVSSSIKLSESKLSVLNPESKKEGLLSDNQNEMHPHFGEVFEFDNKYTIDSNLKINPGDYFVLKLSDNIDLHGIMETDIDNLDIIADGVGTIAKADYDRRKGTITYTFTRYAETYNLVEFSNKLKAYINLNKVQKAGPQAIGRGVVGHDMIKDNINVIYDSMTAREKTRDQYGNWYEMIQNHLNLGSKIIKFNPDTGEFVHYYYVNRDRSITPRSTFYYSSEQNIENMNIEYYKLGGNANLDELMPLSFGVKEDDPRLPAPVQIRSRSILYAGQQESINFNNGLNASTSYIFKVTGRVSGKDKSSYVAHGELKMIDYPGRYVTRWDKQYFFANDATAKANLEIQAVNPENIIKFKKVDQDGNALANAQFQLQYKNNEGQWVVDKSRDKRTVEDGLFEYTKLKPGSYRVMEITAPKGYKKAEDPVAVFDVDENGRIIRKYNNDKPVGDTEENTSNNEEEHGIKPIEIVNKKEYEISFKKVDANNANTTLAGAEFEVWYKKKKTDEKYSKTGLKLYQNANGDKLVLNKDEKAPEGYTEVDKFTTGKDGLVDFKFYESGYYALKEIKAPSGYITPKDYVKEFAAIDGKVKEKTRTETTIKKVENSTNPKLVEFIFKINEDKKPITYYPNGIKDESTITISKDPNLDTHLKTLSSSIISAVVVGKEGKDINISSVVSKDSADFIKVNLHRVVDILLNNAINMEDKSKDPITTDKPITIKITADLADGMFENGKLKDGINLSQTLNLAKADYGKDLIEKRTIPLSSKDGTTIDSYEEIPKDSDPIKIGNNKTVLPFTGSAGVWIGFAILGVILMTLAGIYLAMKGKAKKTI